MSSSTSVRVALIVGISALFAGCAGASSLAPVAQSPVVGAKPSARMETANAFPQAGQSFVMHPGATGTFVYGCGGPVCVWYRKGQNVKAGQIWGFSDAQGIGVSPVNGDVYVADTGTFDIKVYAPNSKTLLADYSDPGEFPQDVAIDAAGNFYVANSAVRTGGPGSVTVYDSAGTIVRTLHEPDAAIGRSVAVDEHKLVVFCFNDRSGQGRCDEFPNARGNGVHLPFGVGYAGGTAFDSAEHVVITDEVNAITDTFDGSTVCGTYTLAGSNVPVMVAFDRAGGLLYNTNTGTRGVAVYHYTDCGSGTLHPSFTYDEGLGPYASMTGVAVTPNAKP